MALTLDDQQSDDEWVVTTPAPEDVRRFVGALDGRRRTSVTLDGPGHD